MLMMILDISMSIVNLFDKKPHQHESEEWWPFADISKYNAVGFGVLCYSKLSFLTSYKLDIIVYFLILSQHVNCWLNIINLSNKINLI